jgi:alpha-glucoside transport system substrate-binding protein
MKRGTYSMVTLGMALALLAILIGLVGQQASAKAPTELQPSRLQAVTVAGSLNGDQVQPMLDEFTSRTGITVQYQGGWTWNQFSACTANNDCPDVAMVPWPGLITELGQAGTLADLSPFISSTLLNANYAPTWIDLGTVDGTLYGVWFNANNKSLVWYDPAEFASHAWTTPTTWVELLALSDQISNTTATAPWSIGSESGPASGWPLTDWFEDILLRSAGPQIYDDLAAHDIPWTHTAVISAMTYFGDILGNESYQLGGKNGTLSTYFIDAIYPPFEEPPAAYLHHQATFVQGILASQFPSQTAGTDYAVFPFPDIDPAYANAAMGAGDAAIVFTATAEAQALINFLITTDAAEVWIAAGNSSPNRTVDFSLYPDPNSRAAAEQMAHADIFRFDLSDQLPGDLNEFLWSQMDDLVRAAPDLQAMTDVLFRIEVRASNPSRIFLPLILRDGGP